MDERKYVWSEEPAGWGRAERDRFDRIFWVLEGDKRLRGALAAYLTRTDDLMGDTSLLVEVATLLTSKGFGHRDHVGRRRAGPEA